MFASSSFRVAAAVLVFVSYTAADQVLVKLVEGRIHGFLVLRDAEDQILASGISEQWATGNRITNDLTFHFKDGSVMQETTVFSQRRTFQLLSYKSVQKGPSFKRPVELSVNVASGMVTVSYRDDDGKPKKITEQMKLPPDLVNGMVPTVLADIDPKGLKTTLSMLVTTPKPRVVKLEISPQGEDPFSCGGTTAHAMRYNIHVELGGITGVVAPIVGKQPPDTQVWIAGGKAPGFIRSRGAMFEGGPIWQIELASPNWPKSEARRKR